MNHRIALVTHFSGHYKHLKRTIKALLKNRGIGHIMQTTELNDNQRRTSLLMEGESTALYLVKAELISQLQTIYPGICIEYWQEMASDTPLVDSRIVPTLNSNSQDSSGFVQELHDAPFDQTGESTWKETIDHSFIQIATAIQNGLQVANEIKSTIGSIKEKSIHITHKSKTAHLSISACISWDQILQVIQSCEILQIKKPIKAIYSLMDGRKSYETNWSDFKAEGHYYVETEDDLAQKFTTMEEFFERLRTERKRPETEIEKVKSIFKKQAILVDDLMATGDLALTDEKLKEYGIAQGGLRTAILVIVKINQ